MLAAGLDTQKGISWVFEKHNHQFFGARQLMMFFFFTFDMKTLEDFRGRIGTVHFRVTYVKLKP